MAFEEKQISTNANANTNTNSNLNSNITIQVCSCDFCLFPFLPNTSKIHVTDDIPVVAKIEK
jgi:hypothetical protein